MHCRVKISKRYDTDFWFMFFRFHGYLDRDDVRLFLSNQSPGFQRAVRIVGPELFKSIASKLFQARSSKKKKKNKIMKNVFRIRFFLGKINNHSLRLLTRYTYHQVPQKWYILSIFESRVDFLFYRLNIVNRLSHTKYFLKNFPIFINGIQVFNRAERLNPWFDELELGKNFRTKLFYYRLILFRLLYRRKKYVNNACEHLEFNYRILCFRFCKLPQKNKLAYPYSVNFNDLSSWSKHNFTTF